MKNGGLALTLACVITLTSAAAYATETLDCAPVTKPEVAALFDRWNESLQTGDAEKVADNYTADAVLLPTVSNIPRTTHDEIKDYFEHFLKKNPKGKIDSSTIHIGCNEAYDVGTYTFDLTGKDGKTNQVHARYSFIYTLQDGVWKVAHHHSSVMPETTPTTH